MQVFKFGGASVKDAEGIKNVYKIIERHKNENLIIVISAMGKTTNALEEVAEDFFQHKNTQLTLLSSIKQYHINIIIDLFGENDKEILDEIENCFVELEWILEEEPHTDYGFVYDQIVSMGEILSTKIIYAYLKSKALPVRWIDARSYIQTDNSYREGKVDWKESEFLIQRDLKTILDKEIIITQGFIGGTSENYTTTLGREGSDYSAAIFASCLNASAVTIWKDVPGVLNADPKLFPETERFDQLPYAEALEMTYYGATVIHPKTIKPLQNKHILLYVKPFQSPEEKGTVIGQLDVVSFDIPAIILKNNQILISISTKDFSFIAETNLSFIFGMFAYHKIKINTMQNSAMTFSCCVDYDPFKVDKLIEQLSKDYKVLYNKDLQLITIRHYNDSIIKKITEGKTTLMEQRSRNTLQLVLRNNK